MVLKTRCLIGLSLFLAYGQLAFSQSSTEAAQKAGSSEEKAGRYSTMSLEQLLKINIETAAKHIQELSDAPSTVTVITEEQIRNSGKTTVADLLKTVAGVDMRYASERKIAIATRGLSEGTLSKRMLFLINGRPINTPSSGEAYVGFPIALDDIRQIEVLRGPGSSLYGGYALGGVVNILTKRPQDYARPTEWHASYGSYDRKTASASVGKTYGNFGFTASASLLRFDEDGIWHKWYGDSTIPDYYKGYDLKGMVEYKDLSVEGGYNNFELPFGSKGQYTSQTSYMRYEQTRFAFGQAQWKRELTKKILVGVRAYYNDIVVDRYDLYNTAGKRGTPAQPYNAGDRRWWKTPYDQNSWGGGIQLNWAMTSSNRAIVGMDYLHEWIDQKSLSSVDGSVDPAVNYYSDKSLSATGVFIQDEQKLLKDRLTLTAGIRYDKYSEFKRSLSPRLSALYKLSSNSALRATYGEAFRIPSLAEYYYSLYQYQKYKLDWKLVPETVHTFELAASRTFPGVQFSISAVAFRNELPHMILNSNDLLEEKYPFAYFYYNSDQKVITQGVEVESEKILWNRLVLRANYTYQDAHFADGKPMVEAPKHKFNVDLTANWGRFMVNANLGYTGSRYDRYYYNRYVDLNKQWVEHGSSKIGSYQVVDMRVAWKINENLRLEASGRNLLDARYFDTGHISMYDVGYRTFETKTQDYTKVNAATNDYRNRDYLNPGRTLDIGLRVGF